MMKKFYSLFVLLIVFKCSIPQIPFQLWNRNFGGSERDFCNFACSLDDGSLILVGNTDSDDGDVSNRITPFGGTDIWLNKVNGSGNVLFQKCFGGTGFESGRKILELKEGGFVLGATTSSNDSDVSGNHLNVFPTDDYWITKLDTLANISWQKCLGGNQADQLTDVYQTSDSGFLVVGDIMDYSFSNNGDITGFHVGNGPDIWVVKLDKNGIKQWQKSLGGIDWDDSGSGIQTPDGGFLVVGRTSSTDGDVSGLHGSAADVWVVKLKPSGQIEWQRCYGGTGIDYACKVINADSGSFCLVGTTTSNDGDVSGNLGGSDIWILKSDSLGNILWQKCFGGAYAENSRDACIALDGGLIITGEVTGDDGMVSGTHGYNDYWVLKMDRFGNFDWGKALGGSYIDEAHSVQTTPDSGFVIAGTSQSLDGDISNYYGKEDFFVVKLSNSTSGISLLNNNLMDLKVIEKNDHLFIQFFSVKNSLASIFLSDINGSLVLNCPLIVNEGVNYKTIDTKNLNRGIYLLQINGGCIGNTKFIKY